MNPDPISGWAKHAWREVPRAELPKRAAEERVSDFHEIYSILDEQTAREQARRCVQCPNPACVDGCLMKNRIPEWLGLVAEGRFLEAADLSRASGCLPEICVRLCPQLCECACILNGPGEPVAINAIERFIHEYAFAHGAVELPCVEPNGFKVAVIGSGPGGLACADDLVKKGYAVTVFESQLLPGGLLVNGVPTFKLEKEVVQRRINLLRRCGVRFRLGVMVGRDISLEELRAEYDAVFLCVGARQARPLELPGAGLQGVFQALPFLMQKTGEFQVDHPRIEVKGKRVAVLGAGSTAMDCLRTAIRCGASEAICISRRDAANIRCGGRDYSNALEEGAKFKFLTQPIALLGDASDQVTHMRCRQTELEAPDASGRLEPRPVHGTEFNVPTDVVLVACGFDPVPFPARSDLAQLAVNESGQVLVNALQMTSIPGVFAGGDLVRGPSLVVHAVRDARKAAAGIHTYLSEQAK